MVWLDAVLHGESEGLATQIFCKNEQIFVAHFS